MTLRVSCQQKMSSSTSCGWSGRCASCSFHTPLGGRRIGANDVDIEVTHGAAELRVSVAGFGVLGIDPKHASLVAVQCNRLPVALQIAAHRSKVDLDELAEAVTAMPRLLDAFAPLSSGLPNPGADHPFSERLDRHTSVMLLDELLVRERRAEVRVLVPNDVGDRVLVRFGDPGSKVCPFLGCSSSAAGKSWPAIWTKPDISALEKADILALDLYLSFAERILCKLFWGVVLNVFIVAPS